jgi:rSAM-partnered protein
MSGPGEQSLGDRVTTDEEWEVFLRERPDEPLTHVGSVTAPNERAAYEQASQLFGWAGTALWLCPAGSVGRYSLSDDPTSAANEATAAGGDDG